MTHGERRRRAARITVVTLAVLAVLATDQLDRAFTLREESETPLADAAPTRLVRDRRPQVHLTFDDGPHLEHTPRILDLLAAHGAQAVFFPIGTQVEEGADLLRRAVAEGHRIGNHTWAHDVLAGIADADFDATILKTQDAIAGATGVVPTCLRPPKGALDDLTAPRAADLGLSVEMWEIDPRDWTRPGARAIVAQVMSEVADGAVVLLHDGGGDRHQTVTALRRLLPRLEARGYRLTALPGC